MSPSSIPKLIHSPSLQNNYFFSSNIGAPQYVRQMLTAIKEKIDSNTIRVGDFNTSLTPMDRSSKMKINAGEGVEKREPSCIVGGNVN